MKPKFKYGELRLTSRIRRKLSPIKYFQENGGKKHGKINFETLNALSVPITKDLPAFVTWNWPLIRKFTFFVFLSGIFAMCSMVVAMIYNLPKTCNPELPWYQGSVFYEIFPASFKDSDGEFVLTDFVNLSRILF